MYVLDTNTLIYFFRGQGKVAKQLLATAPSEVAIPGIVLYELQVGILKSQSPTQRMEQLDQMMDYVTVFPFGEAEAQVAARVRVQLERRGTPIGPYDMLIAATALRHDAVLVTHNIAEFSRIEDLRLEDWYG